MKVFDLYEIKDVVVEDVGLKRYINLDEKLMIKSKGKERGRFTKGKINLIERLINLLGVPGHRGKKQKIMMHWTTGKWTTNALTVLKAFKIIAEKTGQNPIQVFVKAIENAAPRDEITVIEYGGARYPQAVDCSPQRRVDLTLKLMIQGSYVKCYGKKTKIVDALADEIIKAYNNDSTSSAISKKIELERQAQSSR